jgi:hypothetical protein
MSGTLVARCTTAMDRAGAVVEMLIQRVNDAQQDATTLHALRLVAELLANASDELNGLESEEHR